jgi:heme-degrading monooxygenase HmoA
MVVRRWGARASAQGAPKYVAHFRRAVLPQLKRIPGHRGALVLRRKTAGAVELEVLTFWQSMAAIRRFAGADTERAVVEDDAKAVLTSFDTRVEHFDLVLETRASGRRR